MWCQKRKSVSFQRSPVIITKNADVTLLIRISNLQVHHLQRRVYIPRSSRSNLDLAGSTGTGYWDNSASVGREGGLVGPCDNSVMLEEVKTQEEGEMEKLEEIREERDEEEEEEEEGAAGSALSPEEKPLMQRESSSELPQDLEDMPLVV